MSTEISELWIHISAAAVATEFAAQPHTFCFFFHYLVIIT